MAELSGARTAKGEPTIEEPTRAERTIARRAAESRATVPDLELRDEVDVSCAVELARESGASLTAVVVRGCALALREVPRANASYSDGRFELYPRVNVAVTLETQGPDTLATILDGIAGPSAVLNPPQAAALATGSVREAPVVRAGRIEPGLTMALTLVCDHRILYGSHAAAFLAAIKTGLERPQAL